MSRIRPSTQKSTRSVQANRVFIFSPQGFAVNIGHVQRRV